MKHNLAYIKTRLLFLCIYLYLTLPVILFLLFWLKAPFGILSAIMVILGMFFCLRNHDFESIGSISLQNSNGKKFLTVIGITLLWVLFSGVGGYVWQNSDHHVRNEIFNVMVENSWPVYSNTSEHIPLVYYIGYWLPSAAVGKIWGTDTGYFSQALWAVIGILLCYTLLSVKRKKVSVWPLLIFIFFSGLDAVGTILVQAEPLEILGTDHLEAWSWYYQFSSMTTQLFWVFNQAVPAWLACMLVFLYEKPKNMLFPTSMLLLVSSFPFIGLIPFAVYYMITRSEWGKKYAHAHNLLGDVCRNWISIPNILSALFVCLPCSLYLIGNESLSGTATLLYSESGRFRIGLILGAVITGFAIFFVIAELILRGCKKLPKAVGILLLIAFILHQLPTFDVLEWWSVPFVWANWIIFYFLEAGIFLLILYPTTHEKCLFWLNAIWLCIAPLIRVGYSCDFCMRASIPGLLLITLWCIESFDQLKPENTLRSKAAACILAAVLMIGAITPFHEWKRTYMNTINYYEPYTISEEEMYQGPNVRGNASSFFQRYLAK